MSKLFLFIVTAVATVAEMTGQQTVDVLHAFHDGVDGTGPSSTLVEVQPGTFLGTTGAGEYGGTVFQVAGNGAFATLLTFNPDTQGGASIGQLYPASNGFLYGVNTSGNGSYSGSIFAISTTGKIQILQSESVEPSPLMEAADGNLYGVEEEASTGNYQIFRMTLAGSITNIYPLGLNARSIGPLFQASDGFLYGMTAGINGVNGFIFRLNTSGENFSILHTFNPGQGGQGGLMEASNGLLYGVSVYGYPYSPCPGIGSHLFSLSLAGDFTAFLPFTGCPGPGPNGPDTGLMEASDGNLYGTAVSTGAYEEGSLFKVGLDGGSRENIVNFGFSFGGEPGGTGGSGLIQGSDGELYGTAFYAGEYQGGTVFRVGLNLPPPLPVISLMQPASGAAGTTVRIAGQHLLGVLSVQFNGTVSSSVISRGTNYVLAVVPQGATSGPVSVTTQNGTGTSKTAFTVD